MNTAIVTTCWTVAGSQVDVQAFTIERGLTLGAGIDGPNSNQLLHWLRRRIAGTFWRVIAGHILRSVCIDRVNKQFRQLWFYNANVWFRYWGRRVDCFCYCWYMIIFNYKWGSLGSIHVLSIGLPHNFLGTNWKWHRRLQLWLGTGC